MTGFDGGFGFQAKVDCLLDLPAGPGSSLSGILLGYEGGYTQGRTDHVRAALFELHDLHMLQEPELAEQYDYYAVPSFFDGKEKLFEAHLFMSYEDIRDEVRRVLDYALSSPKAAEEL